MNAKFVLYNIELNFWYFTIRFLQTSPTLRYLVPRIYTFVHSKFFNQLIREQVDGVFYDIVDTEQSNDTTAEDVNLEVL